MVLELLFREVAFVIGPTRFDLYLMNEPGLSNAQEIGFSDATGSTIRDRGRVALKIEVPV